MKWTIAFVILASSSLFASDFHTMNQVELCLNQEASNAKLDYPISPLSQIISLESFILLRCQPEIEEALYSFESSKELKLVSKTKKAKEVLDPSCPNCLSLKVRFENYKLVDWGIRRNNIFIYRKDL